MNKTDLNKQNKTIVKKINQLFDLEKRGVNAPVKIQGIESYLKEVGAMEEDGSIDPDWMREVQFFNEQEAKNYTTQDQKDALQEIIQTELLKRGFQVPIESFEEEIGDQGGHSIGFQTEPFQTTPVLFKEIRVVTFSKSLKQEKLKNDAGDDYTVTKFWMTIHASYTVFSGGTNGTQLFEITGKFYNDEHRSFEHYIQ